MAQPSLQAPRRLGLDRLDLDFVLFISPLLGNGSPRPQTSNAAYPDWMLV